MSLFSVDYASGSALLTGDGMRAILPASAEFEPDFARYLALDAGKMETLVAYYHDNTFIHYGEDAPSFPLCLDFAELCAADIRKAAVIRELPMRPAFGIVEYTMNALDPFGFNKRHAICFAVVSLTGGSFGIKYFEPQGDGVWMDEPDDCKSVDKFYV